MNKGIDLNNIKEQNLKGIALDNDVAFALIDGEYKIIKNNEESNAYEISFDKEEIVIDKLL